MALASAPHTAAPSARPLLALFTLVAAFALLGFGPRAATRLDASQSARPLFFPPRRNILPLLALWLAFLGICLPDEAHAQTVTILHSFVGHSGSQDGLFPVAALIQGSDGNFYGTTTEGGSTIVGGPNGLGHGTAFKMTPMGVVTILHNFGDGSVVNDGVDPKASLLIGADGNFYGTTSGGGQSGQGTVFKMTSTGIITILHSFGDGSVASDGKEPAAPLIQGTDGNFYGTTFSGTGVGTVFKMTPTGAETVLHTFGDGSTHNDGAFPMTSLIQGTDGNFYGTTSQGGSENSGTAFRISSTGTLTILHSFADGSVTNDGIYPNALIQGTDGDFYGTTSGTSKTGLGTAFKMTPAGAVTILHTFSDGSVPNDGRYPNAAFIQGSDGNFYSTTEEGGPPEPGADVDPNIGYGTAFQMTPSGTVTILHDFQDGSVTNDGIFPEAPLTVGSDGNFYSTTEEGGNIGALISGQYGFGTLFKLTIAGLAASTTLTSISPASAAVGSAAFTLTVTGTQFVHVATVDWNGAALATTFVSATTLTATVPASDLATAGTARVTVVDPNMGATNALTFTIGSGSSGGTWTARAVSAAPGGTGRILWTRSDGAAGLWILGGNDAQTTVGPTYGPYPGWTAKALSTADDGTSRVLWTNTNGQAGVWVFSAAGVETAIGPTYGPFSGWTAAAVATMPAGYSHVLWTRSDGAAGVWTFDASGTQTLYGPTYGPYAGWTAKGIGTLGDATSRLLWTRSDGAAGLWTMTPSDILQTVGPAYGPYPGWSAGAVGTAGDGTSRVLWTNVNGKAGLWSFGANDAETLVGPTYGPFGGYGAVAVGVASDGTARVLWDRSDRAAGVWSFGANDAESVIGPVYGPY